MELWRKGFAQMFLFYPVHQETLTDIWYLLCVTIFQLLISSRFAMAATDGLSYQSRLHPIMGFKPSLPGCYETERPRDI